MPRARLLRGGKSPDLMITIPESGAMLRSKRSADLCLAAAIVILAIAVSPIGIRLATGRLDLSIRVDVLSWFFAAFLLVVAGAILSWGRARQIFFHLLTWSLLLAVFAAIEMAAIAVKLADRIAPLEDMTVLSTKDRWPPYLMSGGRHVMKDGLLLYRPWQGDGISFNELGLRTALPTPKKAGERRIAVVGGSAAFGWHVLDADTIPVLLQEILRSRGHSNLVVYNFAMDQIAVAQELDLLKHFRALYEIDQVIFYTGANDATYTYMANAVPPDHLSGLLSGVNAFELIKVAGRLKAILADPPPSLLARFDVDILPRLAQRNTLRDGLIAADEYCRAIAVHCDFMLQPMLLTRKRPVGPEVRVAQTLELIYPRYEETITTMYRSTQATGLLVHDLSDLFSQSTQAHFFDVVHVNAPGNRLAAERIAAIILAGLH